MENNLSKLRDIFPPNQISYLPKGGAKLAYVGHAALTDRLLDTDPAWTWEPLALDAKGLPALDENGGLWIKLTVCGVTRLGYGDAGAKKGGDAMKERIGDALRNAGMRFGAALDLWHKGELHADEPDAAAPTVKPATLTKAQADELRALLAKGKPDAEAKLLDHLSAQLQQHFTAVEQLPADAFPALVAKLTRQLGAAA